MRYKSENKTFNFIDSQINPRHGAIKSSLNCIELQLRGKSETEFLNDLVKKGIIKRWDRIDWLGNYKISFK